MIIALAALSVIGIPFLTTMGLGAAGAVLIAVLAAITLVPAIAGFAGSRLTPKHGSRAAKRAADTEGGTGHTALGARWTKWVIAKPLLTVLAVAGILVTLTLPATDLRLALPDNGSAPHASTERRAYDTISDKFGAGFNGPLLVLTETKNGTSAASSQAAPKWPRSCGRSRTSRPSCRPAHQRPGAERHHRPPHVRPGQRPHRPTRPRHPRDGCRHP